ncbi:MAG: hypothetical protein A2504_07430 [Bdellovibrionales bacterium RIFOXYD12_FULL_39_22]|nr:MAG: hypothetical protein A2385_16800 [Bdellovibrionales bacterium RIFOXYB1_FULL_39_21]OFZ44709.1 MAG: hypothetical protein A2485_14660 [Bdellovibrionales bacterium RIFOXYC12_FULL_39_17]OFZ49339.1 MAG: hypothetical protein A2404_08955 [Bdellovibrionales bacterium RIFOXYC1_FULL_39_130]OFZ77075.1 MAG: hypothetical protein A2560_09920 [Bdellovibrionales bacterium RIFOXYD1_FULL_39_84]OFZ95335.1 MAG: hypothetical protein A2504_07430 [Bdellovibrionales bacterium RIFOXYD12_FULL_39_22]HLE13048.1 GN
MDQIISTLERNPEYYGAALALIEKNFNYPAGQHFDVDFYLLMRKENQSHNFIIIDKTDQRILAHIGVIIRQMSLRDNFFPVAFIGGIAVDEKYQGRGLFKNLFNYVISKYEKEVLFFFLWSDQDQLYRKFDFFQTGVIHQTGIDQISHYTGTMFIRQKLAEVRPEDFIAMKKLYLDNIEGKCFAIHRNDSDWEALKWISSADFYLYKSNNKLLSYFVANKGADLKEVIHELVCACGYEQKILAELAQYKLWIPENYFKYNGVPVQSLYSGICRLGNGDFFTHFIQLQSIAVTGQSDPVSLLQSLWGERRSGMTNINSFPLYISGLDSI